MDAAFVMGMFFGFLIGIFFSIFMTNIITGRIVSILTGALGKKVTKKLEKEEADPADYWKNENYDPKLYKEDEIEYKDEEHDV